MNTKPLLACGVVTGPLFVATFLVEGTIPADYDPLRHPVSSLLLVPSGRAQTANFMVADLLTLAFAVCLYLALRPGKGSVSGPFLVGVWAVGLLGAGILVTDPVSGYPPGAPDRLSGYGWHGALHDLFSFAAFGALAAAGPCSAAGSPRRVSAGGRSNRPSAALSSL